MDSSNGASSADLKVPYVAVRRISKGAHIAWKQEGVRLPFVPL